MSDALLWLVSHLLGSAAHPPHRWHALGRLQAYARLRQQARPGGSGWRSGSSRLRGALSTGPVLWSTMGHGRRRGRWLRLVSARIPLRHSPLQLGDQPAGPKIPALQRLPRFATHFSNTSNRQGSKSQPPSALPGHAAPFQPGRHCAATAGESRGGRSLHYLPQVCDRIVEYNLLSADVLAKHTLFREVLRLHGRRATPL